MKKKGISCESCPAFHEPCLDRGTGKNPAHIVAIGISPSGFSIGKEKAFYGHQGRMFRKLLEFAKRRHESGKEIKVYTTYAALVGAHKVTIDHVQNCQAHLYRELRDIRGFNGCEPVVVPLGPMALKSVGIQAKKITDVVGRVMSTTVPVLDGSRKLTVVPCLSMEHVAAKPGTASVAIAALARAIDLAFGSQVSKVELDELTVGYVYPTTADEVGQLVDMIIGYKDPDHASFKKGPEFWPISLDTETNTLHPYHHPDPRVLMLSVAWGARKAATILLDHPDAGYKEERDKVWAHVKRLLACPKPKVFHNWKFDHKFLELVNKAPVNNVKWDTMLGEHYLEEDKKGLYSLKQLTPNYTPAYEGYDDTLHQILRSDGDEKQGASVVLKDAQILMSPLPEGRNPKDWEILQALIRDRQKIKKIPAKKRTPEQKKEFTNSGAQIKRLRKELDVKSSGGKKKVSGGFEQIPLDVILQYAGADADVTWVIFTKQLRKLTLTKLRTEGTDVMKNLYLAASRTLSRMEFRGFAIDQEYLASLSVRVEERLLAAKEAIADRFDHKLNINAAKQVSDFMQKLNFEALPGVDQGGTGKDILARYVEHYPADDPRHIFCDKLLEYRECHKTLQTYLKPIREFSANDGKIHCTFHLNGTATGRLCVAKDTVLVTTCGVFEIAELPETLLGKAHIKTHRGRWQRILKKFYKGEEEMYRVVLSNASQIFCTRHHRFLTPYGWRPMYEIAASEKTRQLVWTASATDERHECGLAAITEVESIGEQEVWDIEVEEDNSYVAQGFINHNSSANPNLQNIPPITCRRVDKDGTVAFEGFNIKKLFIPSQPDYSIVNCDISGAELRVFTAYAQDEDMIKALSEGMDIHSVTASKIYGIPYEEVVAKKDSDAEIKKKRLRSKRVVFGALYGAGAFRLSTEVGCSIEEARELQQFLFQAYPKIGEYIDNTHAELQREGNRVKTLFGRVRRFKLAGLSERHAAEARREAVNFKIQSTSSDLVLSQLCEIDKYLYELDGKLLVTVHDSYVLELPTENIPKLWDFFDYWIVERIKQRFSWLPVPFAYDLEAGPSYGELKEVHRDGA